MVLSKADLSSKVFYGSLSSQHFDLHVSNSDVPVPWSSFCSAGGGYDFCFIKEHIRLTNEDLVNNYLQSKLLPKQNNIISGFRVIYAKSDCLIDECMQDQLFDPNFVKNIPNKKYFFKKHEPVCSVFLSGYNLLKLQIALDNKVNYLCSKLFQLT